jgi:hypothetical protein
MARNRVTSLGYSFVNGTRQITVTDPLFAGFTLESIRLIINETQKVVYTSSMQKSNATVAGNIITLDSSFPVLATGDELTIEMDMGFVGADATAVEINAGKTVIADALTLRGQASTTSDSFNQMATKIENIVGDITVTPLPENDPQWHDLAYEISQYVDFVNPFAFAILLDPAETEFTLFGADAWKISDGRVFTTGQTVTFGANEAGREGKLTKYVIFRRADPYFAASFNSFPRKILGVYNQGMDWSQINMDGTICSFIQNDSALQNPIVFGGSRTLYTPLANQFRNNRPNRFAFPQFRSDATTGEKVLTIPAEFMSNNLGLANIQWPEGLLELILSGPSSFNGPSNLTSLTFPSGLQTLTISGSNVFRNPTNLKSIIFPNGLQTLTISGQDTFSAASNLTSIILPSGLLTLNMTGAVTFFNAPLLTSFILPTGLQNLTITGALVLGTTPLLTYIFLSNPSTTLNVSAITTATAVTKLELENYWNWTVSLTFANLTAQNTKDFMLDRLVDKRFDETNASVVDTATTSPIVTDTNGNGNFDKVFRVGDTITIAAGAVRTIASIQSRNQLTLTANAATTGTGQTYNMNKTLTLSTAVKNALAAAFGANWADPYTAKGWTIA